MIRRLLQTPPFYFGEPAREIQEEITGNIEDPMHIQESLSVTCLRLKIDEIARSQENKIIVPNVCWEKICKTEGTRVTPSGCKFETNDPLDQFRKLDVRFGESDQIIKMLKTGKRE